MVKSLSFSEQYHKLNELTNDDKESIVLWLESHPEATLILTELLRTNPSIIFSLKNIEPEFIWFAIKKNAINLLSGTREELKEQIQIILENNVYFQKDNFLREFLFLILTKETEKYSDGEKMKRMIRAIQYELNIDYESDQIKKHKAVNSFVKPVINSSLTDHRASPVGSII